MGWDFIKILEALTKLYDWLSKEPRVQRTLTWIRRNCAMVAAILVVFIVSSLFLLRPLVVGPSGEAEMLVRSFDGDSTLTEAELKSLWTLTTTRKAVQDAFWDHLVNDDSNTEKLVAHINPFLRALSGCSRQRRKVFQKRLSQLLDSGRLSDASHSKLNEALTTLNDGEDQSDALKTANQIAEAIERPDLTSSNRQKLVDGLCRLNAKLRNGALAQRTARFLSDLIMARGCDSPDCANHGQALAALCGQLRDKAPVSNGADVLLQAMQRADLAPELRVDLGHALAALSNCLEVPDLAWRASRALAIELRQPGLSSSVRASFGRALATVCRHLKDTGEAEKGYRALVRELQNPQVDSRDCVELAVALTELNDSLFYARSARVCFERIEADLRNPELSSESRAALLHLRDAACSEVKDNRLVSEGANALLGRLRQPGLDTNTRADLGRALARLARSLTDKSAARGGSQVLNDALGRLGILPSERVELTGALVELDASISAGHSSREVAHILIEQMRRGDLDIASLARLARELAKVCRRLDDTSLAYKGSCLLAEKIRRKDLDAESVADLGDALATLSRGLQDAGPCRDSARALLEVLERSNLDPRVRAKMAGALASLSVSLPTSSERANTLTVLLRRGRADLSSCWDLSGASGPENIEVLTEILQWPQCVGQTPAILSHAEAVECRHGKLNGPKFGDLAAFLAWLRVEQVHGRYAGDLDRRPPNPFDEGISGWYKRTTVLIGDRFNQ